MNAVELEVSRVDAVAVRAYPSTKPSFQFQFDPVIEYLHENHVCMMFLFPLNIISALRCVSKRSHLGND